MNRIYLSPPDVDATDRDALTRAFDGGWIAPLGPEVDAFETELAAATGRSHAAALSSGTAALHLALLIGGVRPGDRVLVSSLTFAATANAIRYTGASPVFVDSDRHTWTMDPGRLEEALSHGEYAACIPVDLYGQCAAYDEIAPLLGDRGVLMIEDAAEALGASLGEGHAGSFGSAAALSFNGNKIITTSGGGALVADDEEWVHRARFLATQARDPAPHYQHSEIGFNYRLSNLLAALGRSQLEDLDRRVEARRDNNRFYRETLGGLPGVEFMAETPGGRSVFWLTCLLIDPRRSGIDREEVRAHLESVDIESRPVWKPMHLQPVFAEEQVFGGEVSALLFERGLCLPSGSSLTEEQRERVVVGVREAFGAATG